MIDFWRGSLNVTGEPGGCCRRQHQAETLSYKERIRGKSTGDKGETEEETRLKRRKYKGERERATDSKLF